MYILINCLGEEVGRYSTMRGVKIAAGKLQRRLWNTFYNTPNSQRIEGGNMVYRWNIRGNI